MSSQFDSIRSNSIRFNSIQFNSIQLASIHLDSNRFNPFRFKLDPFNSNRSNSIRFNSTRMNPIRSKSIERDSPSIHAFPLTFALRTHYGAWIEDRGRTLYMLHACGENRLVSHMRALTCGDYRFCTWHARDMNNAMHAPGSIYYMLKL